MLVLALDTSTPAVTAGLCRVGAGSRGYAGIELLAGRVTVDGRAHAELLTPHIMDCLDEAGVGAGELDAVVVGCGPGPFTGVRVGMATAAAFGDALEVPVHGVCSLDATAWRARAAGHGEEILVVTDARRREAYHARYAADGTRLAGPAVSRAVDIDCAGVRVAVGDATRLGECAFPDATRIDGSIAAPDPAGVVAAASGALSGGEEPGHLSALYLRRPDAVEPRPRPISPALTRRVGGAR